jgi:hypothetical protein
MLKATTRHSVSRRPVLVLGLTQYEVSTLKSGLLVNSEDMELPFDVVLLSATDETVLGEIMSSLVGKDTDLTIDDALKH